MKLCSSCRFQ